MRAPSTPEPGFVVPAAKAAEMAKRLAAAQTAPMRDVMFPAPVFPRLFVWGIVDSTLERTGRPGKRRAFWLARRVLCTRREFPGNREKNSEAKKRVSAARASRPMVPAISGTSRCASLDIISEYQGIFRPCTEDFRDVGRGGTEVEMVRMRLSPLQYRNGNT